MNRDGPTAEGAHRPPAGVDRHPVDVSGIILHDARIGAHIDLGAGPPLAVLTAIRHRY